MGFSHLHAIRHHSRSAWLTTGPSPYLSSVKMQKSRKTSGSVQSTRGCQAGTSQGTHLGWWEPVVLPKGHRQQLSPASPRTVLSPKTLLLLSFKVPRVNFWVPNESYKSRGDKNQWARHSSRSCCAAFAKETVVRSTILNKYQVYFQMLASTRKLNSCCSWKFYNLIILLLK